MKPLCFELKVPIRQRLNVSLLTPHYLKDYSIEDILELPISLGYHEYPVKYLFNVTGEDTQHIIFTNSCALIDNIGHDHNGGHIEVHGDAGDYVGSYMRSGLLQVTGNVGRYAATGLRGGEVFIDGNAGDYLGAAQQGYLQGMRQGRVIVTGNAGHYVGQRMRRGLIIVEGHVGMYCGAHMIAGTISLFGQAGAYLGYGMRRGTVLLTQKPTALSPTFKDNGAYHLLFLQLLKQDLLYPDCPARPDGNYVQRFIGDSAYKGKGEVLIFQ